MSAELATALKHKSPHRPSNVAPRKCLANAYVPTLKEFSEDFLGRPMQVI